MKKLLLKKSFLFKLTVALFSFLVLFVLVVEKPGSTTPAKTMESRPLLFPRLRPEMVTHLIVTRPGGEKPQAWRKNAQGWVFEGDTALGESLEALLGAIHTLKAEALVSKNPSKQNLFGVDPVSGLRVELWKDSKPLVDFYVGKNAGPSTDYVRLENSNDVFEASPALSPFLILLP